MISKRIRVAFFSLLAGLILFGTALPAQAQLGVAGGLNFESIDDIQTGQNNAQANFESSTGYHVGLVYEFSLGPVNVRPGFLYRRVGEFDLSEIPGDLEKARYTVSAWEVPLDLRISLFPTPILSPYILGGPKATIPRGEDDFDKSVKDLSYTLNVGIGAQISVPATSLRIQPELRYEFGATGFIEEKRVELPGENEGTVSFTPQDSPSFSAFSARLNVLF